MPDLGHRIGPYTILGPLGAGGMGEVFLAHDQRLDREVALKMMPADLARDPERLGRLRREALALAALNHPNIATIHGFEESADGELALVLERVEGESLAERLRGGPLPFEEALGVCAQIAEALEVAHERGVIHRDLKPGNVMLGPRGLVKVLDFGLAKSAAAGPDDDRVAPRDSAGEARSATSGLGEPLTEVGTTLGSPGYMSPEQVQGGEQDERADVFAFGCVLYECLTGRRAFAAESSFELMSLILFQDVDRSLLPARMPDALREMLDRCLEKAPEQRLRSIREARHAIEETLGTRHASALRTGEAAPATPHNLPPHLTRFVGRERELALGARLVGEARLVTLTGVGGSGKTRLAVKLSETLLPDFPHGTWYLDLAPLGAGERVTEKLAGIIGLREEPGTPILDLVTQHLAHRRALILLDNCEHVLAACAELAARILGACDEVRLLATSREPIGVAGERVHAIGTMEPAEAASLFADRAALVKPGFELDPETAPVVAEICRRLDGIPLAIELAAARMRVLAPAEILARLNDRFRLLTGGSRGALPRHQTLRATIQWSYDHLAEPEQLLFTSLGVFRGGWTLGSATAIAMEHGDEFEVLDLLTRLVDKSLVVVQRSDRGASRYRMLETVREYALEQMNAGSSGGSLRARHVNYFLALAETAEKHLAGPAQAEWFDDLQAEHENLLAAFASSADEPDGAEKGLRLATAITQFWSARGYYRVGRRTLEQALARSGAPGAVRANALVRTGGMALYEGDHAAAGPLIEEALATFRALGDDRGVARALSGLGTVATYRGDVSEASAHAEEALELYRRLGQERGMAISLHNLGHLALSRGDHAAARAADEQAIVIMRRVGAREHLALCLTALALAATRAGDLAAARSPLAEALGIAVEFEFKRDDAYALEAAAELAAGLGDAVRAARYCGAAEAGREQIGSPLLPFERKGFDRVMLRLAETVGEGVAAEARRAGREAGFEASARDALEWLEGPAG